MKRISLEVRLGPESHEAVVSTLARMSVADYYHGLSRLGIACWPSEGWLVRIHSGLRAADTPPQAMMCDLVDSIARRNLPNAHALLYMLLAKPFYKIQKQKEEKCRDHTLCDTRDCIGHEQDDYGG